MKKIPSLFVRDGQHLTDEFHPLASWVVNGEGVATRKWDGTAVLWRDGILWARYDAKAGKVSPPGFVPCQEPDAITGHHPGWVPADRPSDVWIRKAFECTPTASLVDGWTYEAVGPKIGGNPERFETHELIPHGRVVVECPRDKAGLIAFFETQDMEGVVWWRDPGDPNCDKVKITGSALGVPR